MNKYYVLLFSLFTYPFLFTQIPNTFFSPSAKNDTVLLGTLSFCNCVCEEVSLQEGSCQLFLHDFFPHEWKQIEQKIVQLQPSCTVSLKAEKKGSSCVFTYDSSQLTLLISRQHRLDGKQMVVIQFFNQALLDTLNEKTRKSILQYVLFSEPSILKQTLIL
jgi:hypothetical protein